MMLVQMVIMMLIETLMVMHRKKLHVSSFLVSNDGRQIEGGRKVDETQLMVRSTSSLTPTHHVMCAIMYLTSYTSAGAKESQAAAAANTAGTAKCCQRRYECSSLPSLGN